MGNSACKHNICLLSLQESLIGHLLNIKTNFVQLTDLKICTTKKNVKITEQDARSFRHLWKKLGSNVDTNYSV